MLTIMCYLLRDWHICHYVFHKDWYACYYVLRTFKRLVHLPLCVTQEGLLARWPACFTQEGDWHVCQYVLLSFVIYPLSTKVSKSLDL